jgi:tRNA dimethylallyltransferase
MPAALPLSSSLVVDALKISDYPLVAIVGPTASGKSALAVRLAAALGGEIINFDSVQVYRGCDVGSGKLPVDERQGVPHHLIDVVEPGATFTAGDFRRAGLNVLAAVRRRGKVPVLVGGTGLYLRALLVGLFAGPPRSEELRNRLRELSLRRGREFVHRMLARKDPASASRIHPRDAQKVIRALEVCFLAQHPFSDLLGQGREGLRGFRVFKVGLNPPRADLYRRIDLRVNEMYAGGLLDEVRALASRSGSPAMPPLEALGYRQALAFVQGIMPIEEAVRDTQTATRQYAKRQLTWFRREPDVRWFGGFGNDPNLEQQVFDWLEEAIPVRSGDRLVLTSSFQAFGM